MSTSPIPSTPAGARLASWLTAINSPSNTEGALRTFHEQSFLPTNEFASNSAANELALRSRTGGFDPAEIINSEPTKISVFLQQRTDSQRWGAVTIEVEPRKPWYIIRFFLEREGQKEKIELEDGAAAKSCMSIG